MDISKNQWKTTGGECAQLVVMLRQCLLPGVSGSHAPSPNFCKSVDPISSRGTDYSHHITTCHPGLSDLPTALSWGLINLVEAKVCTTSVPEGQCLALGQHQGILGESIRCKCDWFRILLEMFTSLVISYQRSVKIFKETVAKQIRDKNWVPEGVIDLVSIIG